MKLAIVASHPVQYLAPFYRELAKRCDLHVFYAHRATPEEQAAAGFGHAFDWDIDLTEGYRHSFLRNVARRPATDRYAGCDTPEIGDRLSEGGFDAVLVPGWHLKSYVQTIWQARRRGLPVMVRGDSRLLPHWSPGKHLAKSLTFPALLRAFDAALYVGTLSHRYYRHYGYPENRLFHSPHCVDTGWFAERSGEDVRSAMRARLGLSGTDRVVLFAGKLQTIKRPLDAVAICAAAAARPHLLVAGSGDLADAMVNCAAEAGVTALMIGFQNQTEMPAAYAAADVLLLPSAAETWGLVCNEALACGRPILISDGVGCATDLAGDGKAGDIFPVGDIATAAIALDRLLSHPPSAAAIAQVSESHGLARATDGVMAAMQRILA